MSASLLSSFFIMLTRRSQHDCDNNCELFREGKYITFRVLRPIAIGEEITAHYGDGYCDDPFLFILLKH
jgi:SET domain-containing protein